ncbi:ankyrin repeat domain-containing protein [Sessilibacter corallicola]|uniref:Ankyrin repeat domain-containing protein n=1 Tax=Sessilibacter corallicola TaxID=2904075 RepID=A0ABQ0AEK6_9GAMM
MIGHEGKTYGFDRLFGAVRFAPQDVPALLKKEPNLLDCTNYSGETVLQFFSMEGDTKIVSLLLSCGAEPDEWSIYFASNFGHIDTLLLLFEAGGKPDVELCKRSFLSYEPSKFKIKQMHKLFNSYGFDW